MKNNRLMWFFIIQLILLYTVMCFDIEGDTNHVVLIVLMAKNKLHLLPHFLFYFEDLDYPKENLALLIKADDKDDEITEYFKQWVEENEHKYLNINTSFDGNVTEVVDEEFWGFQNLKRIIEFKEDGLNYARESDADFVWFIDLEAFHTYPYSLQNLIKQKKTVVSPMLASKDIYSNFWSHMTENYWYKTSDEYFDIINYEKRGCFPVEHAFASILVNLNDEQSKNLTFINKKHYQVIPSLLTDSIVFSLNAKENGIDMFICNDNLYGQILPMTMGPVMIADQIKKLISLLSFDAYEKIYKNAVEINEDPFEQIFCINLKRRPDRKENMEKIFKKLGLNGIFFDAIDWKDLNETYLKSLDLRVLKNYDKGDVTLGIIGNFLSHYFIWEKVIANRYKQVIILEDDANIHDDFLERMHDLKKEIKTLKLDWEFIYLGRKPLRLKEETEVSGSKMLVNPSFSWWTVGYILTYEGAVKLYNQGPLQKLIPIDEYIPIMFDRHPQKKYSKHYEPRNVRAFAIKPAVMKPTHFAGDEGYSTDTEDSPDVTEELDQHLVKLTDFHLSPKFEL